MPVLNNAGQFAATATQARNLETMHLRLFNNLVNSWEKYHLAKLDIANRPAGTPFKNNLLTAHTSKLIPITGRWMARQQKYESIPGSNAKFTEFPIKTIDWLDPAKFTYLKSLRDKMDKEKTIQGMGFIPLLIWGIIAIVASFSAVQIVDEMNTTTEEQANLTTVTNNFCVDNQLTPEQCSALLAQQTAATTNSDGFPWIKVLLFGGAALLLMPKVRERATNYVKSKANNYVRKRIEAAA